MDTKCWTYEEIALLANTYDLPLTFSQAMMLVGSVASCAIENIYVDEKALVNIMYTMCAGNRVTLEGGVNMIRVHDETDECQTLGCAVHNPTDHPMRIYPQSWNSDLARMERICLCGFSHPDPDHINWIGRHKSKAILEKQLQHTCCAKKCCQIPKDT